MVKGIEKCTKCSILAPTHTQTRMKETKFCKTLVKTVLVKGYRKFGRDPPGEIDVKLSITQIYQSLVHFPQLLVVQQNKLHSMY